jgi:hypothetical protein
VGEVAMIDDTRTLCIAFCFMFFVTGLLLAALAGH